MCVRACASACHFHACVHAVSQEVEGEGREEAVKVKEQAILLLGKVLAKHGFAEG